ncbi:MAG: BatA domain-containing protein [Bacteroidota bacterium]
MQFLYPTFLFALAALAIPIIIHLFHFRRFKKVYFTNVRFLKEVKEETSARSKLRNLLVLLMRCLALAFLVFAFAQPFIPQDVEVKAGQKAVSVFVDNSFSMSSLSEDVPLLDKAKQRAREIVSAYTIEDQFQILTHDFEGRHQRMLSQEDALGLIDEIEKTPAVKQLSSALTRQQQALNTSAAENQVSYLISDFQKNITDIQNYTDTTLEVNLLPLQAVQERNISIDSAWFDAPVQVLNQTNRLLVRVANLSDEEVDNIRLSIRYDGQTRPVGTLSIPARASVVDTVNMTISRTGWYQAELAITDFPVQFDDKYFLAFNVAEVIKVLVINEVAPNAFLNAALGGISNFELTNRTSGNLDYSSFSDYQLIITNGLNAVSTGLASELNQYSTNGGNLLVFPGRTANLSSYNSFLNSFPANQLQNFETQERRVGQMNTEEFVFNDVFENTGANLKLPVTQGNYKMSTFSNRGEERLLVYRDGTSYLNKYRVGEGHLYFCAAPLEEEFNDLIRNGEIFIPMLYKMAISAGRKAKIANTIGKDEVIEARHRTQSTDLVYKLKGIDNEFIPEQRIIGSKVILTVNNEDLDAGFYDLYLNEEESLGTYAFNYDRTESDLQYYSQDDLQAVVGEVVSVLDVNDRTVLTSKIQERSQGITLWRWCLILALVFLALEILLLRFWRV